MFISVFMIMMSVSRTCIVSVALQTCFFSFVLCIVSLIRTNVGQLEPQGTAEQWRQDCIFVMLKLAADCRDVIQYTIITCCRDLYVHNFVIFYNWCLEESWTVDVTENCQNNLLILCGKYSNSNLICNVEHLTVRRKEPRLRYNLALPSIWIETMLKSLSLLYSHLYTTMVSNHIIYGSAAIVHTDFISLVRPARLRRSCRLHNIVLSLICTYTSTRLSFSRHPN